MNKVRLNEWAKQHNYKSVDVMKKLLAAGVRVNRMTEKVDIDILENVIVKNLSNPHVNNSLTKADKLRKRNNYRRNLYDKREERNVFSLDDLFEQMDLDYSLSDEMKIAIGINISKKFRGKKGYNGSYLVNLYKLDQQTEIMEFLNSII